jgi:hypothetical protein
MAGHPKKKYEATQQQAMDLIQFIGVSRLDDLLDDQRDRAWKALGHLLEAMADVSPETARRHIAKAARRQRHPEWKSKNKSGWGGQRPGAGRKSEMIQQILSGETEPDKTFPTLGETFYLENDQTPLVDVGRVPGATGMHVLQKPDGTLTVHGGYYLRRAGESWGDLLGELSD